VIISRYLTKEVMNTLIGVTFVLLLVFLCQQTVRYLNYVAVGKIPTNVLIELISFEAPYILSFLLPLGLYLGILLTYGRLYADNEMAILQLYGYGQHRLLRLTMLIAVVVAVVVFVLMAWINPFISAKRQQVMASDEATVHLVQTLSPGRFQASPDGRHVMYVEKLSRDRQRAQNVFLAQAKKTEIEQGEQNAWMLVLANSGYQVQDMQSKDQFFVTEDGYRYEGVPGQNDYKIIQFKKYSVRIPESEARVRHEENETLSMSQLWQDYGSPKRAAELQWRYSLAITTFFLAILAVPLSANRPRQNRYLTLIPAVLIYVIYIDLLYIARHWVEQGSVSIAIGMWWVHGLMMLLVLVVMLFNWKPWFSSHD
jgi:lipopolysaccharide export system permease protein